MKFNALFVILALSVSTSAFAQKKSQVSIDQNKKITEGTASGGTVVSSGSLSGASIGGAVESGPGGLPTSGGGVSAAPIETPSTPSN